MDKLEKVILNNPRWSELKVYIKAIKGNINENPNISLDNSKSILEAIAKTILNDVNFKFKDDESIGKLLKLVFENLPVFSALSQKDKESSKKIINSFVTIVVGIGEFRNRHGFFGHGQDLDSDKFNEYLIELVVSSADLISSFLVAAHTADLKNRKRLTYEEYEDFNKWFDESEKWVVVKGVEHAPSRVLFHSDIEFYKQELLEFENNPEALIDVFEDSSEKERLVKNIIDIKTILSKNDIERFNKILEQQQKIHSHLQNNLKSAGLFEAMEKLKISLKPAIESINKINKELGQEREYIKEDLRDEILDEHFEELKSQQEQDGLRDR